MIGRSWACSPGCKSLVFCVKSKPFGIIGWYSSGRRLAYSSYPRAASVEGAVASFGAIGLRTSPSLPSTVSPCSVPLEDEESEFTQEARRDEETNCAGAGPSSSGVQGCSRRGKLTARSSRSRGWSPEVELTMTKPASRQDGLPVVERESESPTPIRLLHLVGYPQRTGRAPFPS
ncbi:hypothetical protein B0I37DRAFT_209040 [Chaetomium sp. MPI-CAGE-AT-0009]|nr:hypothetical protein B0I37DRAFT_209040 [Chaetomium sp. MPI-CAGE-AT-0009]